MRAANVGVGVGSGIRPKVQQGCWLGSHHRIPIRLGLLTSCFGRFLLIDLKSSSAQRYARSLTKSLRSPALSLLQSLPNKTLR